MGESIKGAELMAVGTWNGREFTARDLDGIASSFDALSLSGRVPLKLGHTGDDSRDGHPALGWVERIYREGDRLLADLKDVPKLIYDGIKSGLYKFVSVELLKDVQADTRKIPWVLDAVALLGATQPAIGVLKDLQSLTMARRPAFRFGERLSLSREGDEAELLRRQNAELRAELLSSTIETDIRTGRVYPAERERFTRKYGKAGTLADWQAWIADVRPPGRDRFKPHTFGDATTMSHEDSADAEVDAIQQHMKRRKSEDGVTLDYRQAAIEYFRANREAGQRWLFSNGNE